MPLRRHPKPGRPGAGHEDWLVDMVRRCGVADELMPYYLAFARELEVSLRRGCLRPARAGGFADYSRRTKRVVMKWFRRGLSGLVLARIGQALTGRDTEGFDHQEARSE